MCLCAVCVVAVVVVVVVVVKLGVSAGSDLRFIIFSCSVIAMYVVIMFHIALVAAQPCLTSGAHDCGWPHPTQHTHVSCVIP